MLLQLVMIIMMMTINAAADVGCHCRNIDVDDIENNGKIFIFVVLKTFVMCLEV